MVPRRRSFTLGLHILSWMALHQFLMDKAYPFWRRTPYSWMPLTIQVVGQCVQNDVLLTRQADSQYLGNTKAHWMKKVIRGPLKNADMEWRQCNCSCPFGLSLWTNLLLHNVILNFDLPTWFVLSLLPFFMDLLPVLCNVLHLLSASLTMGAFLFFIEWEGLALGIPVWKTISSFFLSSFSLSKKTRWGLVTPRLIHWRWWSQDK